MHNELGYGARAHARQSVSTCMHIKPAKQVQQGHSVCVCLCVCILWGVALSAKGGGGLVVGYAHPHTHTHTRPC